MKERFIAGGLLAAGILTTVLTGEKFVEQNNEINLLKNTLSALQADLDTEKVRSCGNENVLRELSGYPPVSLKECSDEGKKWQDNQKDLFPPDQENKQ